MLRGEAKSVSLAAVDGDKDDFLLTLTTLWFANCLRYVAPALLPTSDFNPEVRTQLKSLQLAPFHQSPIPSGFSLQGLV